MSGSWIRNGFLGSWDRQTFRSFKNILFKVSLCSEFRYFPFSVAVFFSFIYFSTHTHGVSKRGERFQCSTNTTACVDLMHQYVDATSRSDEYFHVFIRLEAWVGVPPSQNCLICRCSLSCNLHIVSVASHWVKSFRMSHILAKKAIDLQQMTDFHLIISKIH